MFIYDGEMIEHCLVKKVSTESITYIQEHGFIEVGILPEGGGINDQWEKDMVAFSIIGSEKAAIKDKEK